MAGTEALEDASKESIISVAIPATLWTCAMLRRGHIIRAQQAPPIIRAQQAPRHCGFSPFFYPTTSHKEVIPILEEIRSPLCLSFKGSVREDGQRNLTSTSQNPQHFMQQPFLSH